MFGHDSNRNSASVVWQAQVLGCTLPTVSPYDYSPPRSRDPTSQNHIVQLPGQGRPDNELEEDGGNEHSFPPPAMQAARKQENGYSDP